MWVPTVEGVRPFVLPKEIVPETRIAVLFTHRCQARADALKTASQEYMKALYKDPMIVTSSMKLSCDRCGAEPGVACRDLRQQDRFNKNPHQSRLLAGALAIQETAG